ncbi:archaeal proteasome endopeptidase complex subunit beta [Haloterrigena sp. SYSU A558-1]|uniref:Proteasome subunit beta 1 n=2 Tax=Haloterrigena TaxID=121871 RepID=PSB1_HALTV|nr:MULTISPECIES: archaeal proteasome endopeptidase complex subunit beta [Haloterrigena]D2RQX3.1 RecName: Full=Proteasome subunit beta 1; AltName: Full=20S proteasome beta subunit 1; AltName: Full=Proteasome core protein PsmB 1; Flags: Precursor [Haloterrigena turkmenica DSM 5511]ADB60454.1 proteasome endopeptidase complex, beta subunit [Haloterrigena turkmenica DSM 5511]NUC72336.1 archaeal proteasome endopeptidase complex subunit beta [Haloterrigena gelatinilytica]
MRAPQHNSDFSRTVDQLADDPNPYEPEIGSMPQNDLTRADLDNVNKTGTTTIGISTADGVVIATDMRASLGGRFVSNKNVQKVEQIHPTGALTLVGSVGGAQSFISSLRAEVNLYESRRGEQMSIDALATLAGNFARGGPFFAIHPILGGVDEEGSHVYSIDPAGGVMEDDYTVTGSGMQLAYGHLEQAYEEDMSNEEAVSVAAHGIKSAVERDTGSGNGVFLCEITDEGVDIHGHHDFDEVL